MKLKYYGTAAAEGIPALYCSCDVCKYSKKAGGRNIRTRSQALLNDSLLIDICPDTLYHYHVLGLPLEKIEYALITHKHADHLDTPTITMRSKGFVTHDLPRLNIYGSMPTIDLIFDELRKNGRNNDERWNLYEIAPFETKTIDSFCVTPYKANHAFNTYPYIYDISDGEKRMLYAHDSGFFLDETWHYLENFTPFFNLVSLDCTMGIADSAGHFHMNIPDCERVKSRLIDIGCADKDTIFVLNHFSHNGHVSYDALSEIADSKGFTVSYDGLEIIF